MSPTIGSSYFPYKITIRDITLLLEIWDTAGQVFNGNKSLFCINLMTDTIRKGLNQWLRCITEAQRQLLLYTISLLMKVFEL
jgi:hypothetical protein